MAQEAQIILQQLQFTASLQAEEAKLERQRLIDEAALRATSQDLEMRKMKAKTDELMTMLRDYKTELRHLFSFLRDLSLECMVLPATERPARLTQLQL